MSELFQTRCPYCAESIQHAANETQVTCPGCGRSFTLTKIQEELPKMQHALQENEQARDIRQTQERMEAWLRLGQYDLIKDEWKTLQKNNEHLGNAKLFLYALCAQNRMNNLDSLASAAIDLKKEELFVSACKTAAEKDKVLLRKLYEGNIRALQQAPAGENKQEVTAQEPDPEPAEETIEETEEKPYEIESDTNDDQPAQDTTQRISAPIPPVPAPPKGKKIYAIIAIAAVLLAAVVSVILLIKPAPSAQPPADKEGVVYPGQADGFNGPVYVEVTAASDGTILALKIGDERFAETEGFGSKALESSFAKQFIGKSLPVQKGDVDGISGATYTTNAVIEAINRAYESRNKASSTEAPEAENTETDAPETENANKADEGFVTQTHEDGSVYEGQVQNGKRHGQGKMTYADGAVYEGEWKNDQRNGQGKMTYADGDVYEGEWKDDKMNGLGKYTFADGDVYAGDVYVGEFKDGYRSGQGTYTYANGAVYEGEWKDGNLNGQGKMTYANGAVYEGEWKNDQRTGQGKMTFADGAVYEGQFKDDKFDGLGKLTYANGTVYEGEWKNDQPNGQGKTTFVEGGVYEGGFKDGYRSGQGTLTFADGDVYVGEWKDGYMHGQGTYTFADGSVMSGQWIKDEFQDE